jgi:hypothetical protein
VVTFWLCWTRRQPHRTLRHLSHSRIPPAKKGKKVKKEVKPKIKQEIKPKSPISTPASKPARAISTDLLILKRLNTTHTQTEEVLEAVGLLEGAGKLESLEQMMEDGTGRDDAGEGE